VVASERLENSACLQESLAADRHGYFRKRLRKLHRILGVMRQVDCSQKNDNSRKVVQFLNSLP
jgi:hypothetical protein